MDSLVISRRRLLAGTAAVFLASTVPGRPAILEIIAASAAVVSSALEFQKKGGSLGLQFDALNAKLDQVLSNQKLLLDAISEVNDSVLLVLKATSMVPEQTVVLIHLRDAQRVYDKLRDRLSELQENPNDRVAKGELANLFGQLNDIAINLKNDATGTSTPLELALACERAKAITIALAKQKFAIGKDRRKSLLSTCIFLEEAYISLVAENGILSNLPAVDMAREKVLPLIEANKLRGVLPANFSDIPESRTVIESKSQVETCVKTGYQEKKVDGHYIYGKVFDEEGSHKDVIGHADTFDQISTLAYPQFAVTGTRILNGRYCYQIEIGDPARFQVKTWSRRVNVSTTFDQKHEPVEERSDPVNIIHACSALAVDKDQIPQEEFQKFLGLLGAYDALVAVETRILTLQGACLASKDEVGKLKDTLRT